LSVWISSLAVSFETDVTEESANYIRPARPRSERPSLERRIAAKSLRECSLRVSAPTLRASRRRRSIRHRDFFDSDPFSHVPPSADADFTALVSVSAEIFALRVRLPVQLAGTECAILTFSRIFGQAR